MLKKTLCFSMIFSALIFLSYYAFSSEEAEKENIKNLGVTFVSPEDFKQKVEDAIDETDKTVTFPSLPVLPETRLGPISGPEPLTTDPAWDLLDTETITQRILDGEYLAIEFDHLLENLTIIPPVDTLTTNAHLAVDKAPDWLRMELEDLFARLSASDQDTYANIILNEVDPYVDEVAWSIAHIAPQDLTNSSFYTELIQDNAHTLYDNDSYLDYCEIVNYGDSVSGGNYYSTIKYRVDEEGIINEYEMDKDKYYWFVVHPRGSDEIPTYIDPDATCSSSGTPAAPPEGKFWRDWLFNGANNKEGGQCDNDQDGTIDGDCPVLKNELSGIQVLWAGLKNVNGPTNGAIGVVNDWVRRSLGKFGDKDGCRPIEPVTIYYWMDGACGEWGDLTMAAARAALIPTIVLDAGVNDHCWNEFWEREWHGWEPVNNYIDFPLPYDNWWSDEGGMAGCNAWRGDGYGWSPADHYTPYCTLTVTVYDNNNYPVDGARVKVYSEYLPPYPFLGLISQTHTDDKGQVKFTLGDNRNFYVRVESALGNYPASGSVKVIDNSVAGTDYSWSCNLTGVVPRLSVSPDSWPPDPDNDYLLEVSYNVNTEYIYGDGYNTGIWYNNSVSPGNIDFFIADSANYSTFTSGGSFDAFEISLDSTSRDLSFKPPYEDDWYAVFSNEAAIVLTQIPDVTMKLYKNNGYIAPVQELMVTKTPEDYAHLDWEDVNGENVYGYNVYRSTTASDVGEGKTKEELEPFLIAQPIDSEYTDPDPTSVGECFYYSVRTTDKDGNISD